MLATLILWTHALAALLFAALALWAVRRDQHMRRAPLAVALGITALWALAVAGIGTGHVATEVAEGARDLAWLGLMLFLYRDQDAARRPVALGMVYGVVSVVAFAALVLTPMIGAPDAAHLSTPVASGVLMLRMLTVVAALVLLHNLFAAAAQAVRAILLAVAILWVADCAVLATAYLGGVWSDDLVLLRGLAMVAAAAPAALGLHRGDWSVQVSRTVTYQSLSLVAIGLYLILLAVATSALAAVGGDHARILQTGFVFGSTAAILTLVSTPWLRAWTKVKLAKHFFRHRYDYRAEWIRFTDTLGDPAHAAPLDQRVVKAIADLVDAPAGVLLLPADGRLRVGAAWNWDESELPADCADGAMAEHLAESGRIVELDDVRAARDDSGDGAATPRWMRELPQAWALVPLIHFGRLAGAILLARPPVDRALDWEDFDLLRIAGRQVASYLAEERAHAALGEAQRFEEFNRRFAFILHDIKNLVSQLTLVARNAERHADNPEFRADMVATLKDSADRMTALLARLAQRGSSVGASRAVDVAALARTIAAARRSQHPVAVTGSAPALATADPARLEQLLGHLVQNAVEASAGDRPVTISVTRAGGEVAIDVVDRGCGMSAAFIRDKLFRPFVSTKSGGFGIGAFESQQLAQAMGGTLDVASREGEGTRFRLVLPAADTAQSDIGRAA